MGMVQDPTLSQPCLTVLHSQDKEQELESLGLQHVEPSLGAEHVLRWCPEHPTHPRPR